MIRLVVFLGNPGSEYARTRHNVAWMIADQLAAVSAGEWQRKFKGLFSSTGGVSYLKPETFMNRSGESVAACTQFYRIDPGQIMVVHDDVELRFGVTGIREGGGLGGHNGLRDIERALGTRDFQRFRFGISRPDRGEVASHVLSRFSPDEERELPRLLEQAAEELRKALVASRALKEG